MRSLVVAALALAAVAGLASAVQDPYAGKSAAELIELCKRRLSEPAPELGTTVPYEEFAEKYRKVVEGRLARVLKVWKQDNAAPPFQQILNVGRIYRSWGNTQQAAKQFELALRKAQDPWAKRLSNVELAYLAQLLDQEPRARQLLAEAQKQVKTANVQKEMERLLAIIKGKREYVDLLAKRRDNPRDWRAHWAVCFHLMNYRDQDGIPWLMVETLVAFEWLRVAFPSSTPVKDGGVNGFILDVAIPTRDVETGIEAAERLWQLGPKTARVENGDLMLQVGTLLKEDEEWRQQALRCFRWLQTEKPNHPAVAGGQLDKEIQALERQKGVKRETTPPPSPPWRK